MAGQIISKRCSKCKRIKSVAEFAKRSDRPSGYRSDCKECRRKYRQSEKGQAVSKRYARSEKRKLIGKRYRQTERGKQTRRKACAKYKKSKKGKAQCRIYAEQYRLRHPTRDAAREAVKAAIRNKQLPRPDSLQCSCGESAKQYHHHKGYATKHFLDVIAVCKNCHIKLHQNLGTAR